MKKAILPILFAILALDAAAQTPQLVQEIVVGSTGSDPAQKAVYNNKLYFAATDAANGNELWSYDGTTLALAFNINPGAGNGLPQSGATLNTMVVFNGKLYFAGDNGTSGSELMVYDGVNPPSVVVDINAGSAASTPQNLTVIGNRLFFSAVTNAAGRELYIYDGTNAPVLFDLNPAAASSQPREFVSLNNKVYFVATTAATGTELFLYDGVTNTAGVAAEVNPGATSSAVRFGPVLNNKLYLAATSAANGYELWSFDGTSVIRVTDIAPGAVSGVGGAPYGYNGQVYLPGGTVAGQEQLYRFDPATGNASFVWNINPGSFAFISDFYAYKGKLYFSATDGSAHGQELWVTDGTTTMLAGDIDPGSGDSRPNALIEYNGTLYFTATTAATGKELYRLKDPTSVHNAAFNGLSVTAANPVEGDATLRLNVAGTMRLHIQLTDASGKIVWHRPFQDFSAGESSIVMPMAALPAGIYFYKVAGADGRRIDGQLVKR